MMDVDLTTGRKYFRDPSILDRHHLIMSQIYVLYLSHFMVPTPVFLEQAISVVPDTWVASYPLPLF